MVQLRRCWIWLRQVLAEQLTRVSFACFDAFDDDVTMRWGWDEGIGGCSWYRLAVLKMTARCHWWWRWRQQWLSGPSCLTDAGFWGIVGEALLFPTKMLCDLGSYFSHLRFPQLMPCIRILIPFSNAMYKLLLLPAIREHGLSHPWKYQWCVLTMMTAASMTMTVPPVAHAWKVLFRMCITDGWKRSACKEYPAASDRLFTCGLEMMVDICRPEAAWSRQASEKWWMFLNLKWISGRSRLCSDVIYRAVWPIGTCAGGVVTE